MAFQKIAFFLMIASLSILAGCGAASQVGQQSQPQAISQSAAPLHIVNKLPGWNYEAGMFTDGRAWFTCMDGTGTYVDAICYSDGITVKKVLTGAGTSRMGVGEGTVIRGHFQGGYTYAAYYVWCDNYATPTRGSCNRSGAAMSYDGISWTVVSPDISEADQVTAINLDHHSHILMFYSRWGCRDAVPECVPGTVYRESFDGINFGEAIYTNMPGDLGAGFFYDSKTKNLCAITTNQVANRDYGDSFAIWEQSGHQWKKVISHTGVQVGLNAGIVWPRLVHDGYGGINIAAPVVVLTDASGGNAMNWKLEIL